MNTFKSVKKQLKFCIKSMEDSSSLFVVHPQKDFSRKRKHFFGSTLMHVLLLESGSLKDELFKLFGYTLDAPSASSFIQARDKIRPDAFHSLFDMFNIKGIVYWRSMVLCYPSAVPYRIKKLRSEKPIIRMFRFLPIISIQVMIF